MLMVLRYASDGRQRLPRHCSNILFPHRAFILTLPCWDFRLHEFPCNYISVTLHVNKLKGKKMPSVQLLYQKKLCDGSRLFCLVFFSSLSVFSKTKVLLSPASTFWHTMKSARDDSTPCRPAGLGSLSMAALTDTEPSSQSERGSRLI